MRPSNAIPYAHLQSLRSPLARTGWKTSANRLFSVPAEFSGSGRHDPRADRIRLRMGRDRERYSGGLQSDTCFRAPLAGAHGTRILNPR